MSGALTGALTGAPARALRRHSDPATVLSVVVVVLLAVPSELRVGALGAAGSPAVLAGLGCLLVWSARAASGATAIPLRPRLAVLAFGLTVLLAWTAAQLRPLPPSEGNAADLGVLRAAAFCGVLLLAAEVGRHRDRLLVLQRRLVLAGAALALLGLVQFVTGAVLVDRVWIPGLVSAQEFSGVSERGGFVRPAGTAMSALEYSFALAVVFPYALGLAVCDRHRALVRRVLPCLLVGLGLLTSVSRSGVVGIVLGALVLLPAWSPALRRRMLLLAPFLAVGFYLLVPGMSGTLRDLFTTADQDPSALSRTGSYEVAAAFVESSPVVGRGFGTFLPAYRILDNQYLLLAVEVGLLGLVAFVALLGCCVVGARGTLRTRTATGSTDADAADAAERDRQLRQAALGTVLVGAALAAVLDVFAFPMAAGSLALVCGLALAQGRSAP
ncbi:O-antigen ligase family protein [Nocardioides zeae]|uniref:O-antigen ligase family protein n=1 Tax=Nocardioides imazamoxiresistens TaxID=3231893 RepID=A0ABU3PUV2_9ACTN|nr:O-antigen ligase family protein [Nocardioides zeae]MDT9592545.1 O-antigen ligase family protein [Nocardioides zeae]